MNLSFNFITHNAKGLGDKKKRQKQFRWLQNQVKQKGVIFMQETDSCNETQKKWVDEFGKKKMLFSHGKSKARGVAIGFCGNLDYELKKSEIDSDGRFIILEAKINK